MTKYLFPAFLFLSLICTGCQASVSQQPSGLQTPFLERVKTCLIDYVRDKDYISTGYEHIFTGNTYLSCLYHTILGNRNGVGFPYFIKASYAGNLQWLVEPTTKPFYFDQNLIDNAMNIPCFTRNDADKTVNEVNEGCKGIYDFAHYLISGTVISDTCRFVGCENLPEDIECIPEDPSHHYRTCRTLIPSYQKDFEVHKDTSINPRYMYQRPLPLVHQNQWYFEDVHIWRYYGAIPIQLDPNNPKIQKLKAIVDDGKEHLFDIVETNIVDTDGYGNGIAFWELIY